MADELAIPMLVCRDASAEISFCQAAFGAMELSRYATPEGAVVHALLRIGDAIIMVHSEVPELASRAPSPGGASPVVVYLYLEDAVAVVGRAQAAGAQLLLPVADTFWGDRVGRIVDPSGHVWNLASRRQTPDA